MPLPPQEQLNMEIGLHALPMHSPEQAIEGWRFEAAAHVGRAMATSRFDPELKAYYSKKRSEGKR